MTVFKMFKIFLMILLFSFPAWAHTHDDPNLHEDNHHLHEADFEMELDGCIDFKDFSILASQWLNTNCDCWNNWCDGADITENGCVDLFDLAKIASNWLKSLDGGEEKNSSN